MRPVDFGLQPRLRQTVLTVADPDPDVQLVVAQLAYHGFQPQWAHRFGDAKARLSAAPPALLLADIRLAEYNGLHLVLRGKAVSSAMAAVLFAPAEDVVLRREAEVLGATFVVRPIAARELLAAVWRTYCQSEADGPVRAPFERRRAERRVAIAAVIEDRRTAERRRDVSDPLAGRSALTREGPTILDSLRRSSREAGSA